MNLKHCLLLLVLCCTSSRLPLCSIPPFLLLLLCFTSRGVSSSGAEFCSKQISLLTTSFSHKSNIYYRLAHNGVNWRSNIPWILPPTQVQKHFLQCLNVRESFYDGMTAVCSTRIHVNRKLPSFHSG